MADMGYYGNLLQVGGAAFKGVSAWFGAKTQRENLRAQRIVAESNARLAERGAQAALLAGERRIGAHTMAAGQQQAGRRARLAANGVALDGDGAAELLASADLIKDWEVQDLQREALYQAFGYRQQAAGQRLQAAAAGAGARATSPFAAMAASLLGSAGQVASGWYR